MLFRSFQPSEVDYVEMSDEKIIEQAIKAGISREIAMVVKINGFLGF